MEILGIFRLTDNMPGWRNGRRCGLKIRCPKGRAGSTPALGTISLPTVFMSSINLALGMISTQSEDGAKMLTLSTNLSFELDHSASRFCQSLTASSNASAALRAYVPVEVDGRGIRFLRDSSHAGEENCAAVYDKKSKS